MAVNKSIRAELPVGSHNEFFLLFNINGKKDK